MLTIKSSEDIDRLFAGGRRVSTPALLVLWAPSADPAGRGRIVFVAGKRLGGAVVRNRSKRLLREAARACGGPWPGLDVALIARAATSGARLASVTGSLEKALGTIRSQEATR